MTHTIASDGKLFFDQINTYLNVDDRLRVQEAFALARREHGEQRRKSGELFFTHPLSVSFYLSEYMLDAPALIAALLHDVAEDTKVSIEDIEAQFGAEVARLVDGVTKLKDVTKGISAGKTMSKQEVEDATLLKLLGVMTLDVRAVIIKLFDRLHNMRTIRATPYHRQVYKAKETLSVYAPLANRLGIWKLKNELETLSLDVLDNNAFNIIKQRREQIQQDQQELYQLVSGQIFDCLLAANIDVRNVFLAPENIYTVYEDICDNGVGFYDIDKTMRLVVLLDDWLSCYPALGHLHQLWKPVPGKFDDYIAYPRDNLYRSLHTTVVHINGRHIKLRIRSVSMDKVSEIGVLARYLYKGTMWSKSIDDRIDAFFENITENINVEPQNPTIGVKGVVEDIFRQQIRVYTPNGDVIELVKGATAIDFAYVIHTGLGNQCHAAYVNDALYPLNKPLQNGDQVRIVKKLHVQPQRAWLDEDLGYIITNYARTNAQRWFRRLSSKQAIMQGEQLLQDELNMLGVPNYEHKRVANLFGYVGTSVLYYDLGRAELLPTVIATRVLEDKWEEGPTRNLDNTVYSNRGEKFVVLHADNRQLRLCGTCQPRPPESVLGFLRKDGGVTMHQEGCHMLLRGVQTGRVLKLAWGQDETRKARLVTIQVKVYDRPGLLFEITQLMQNEQINISYIVTPPAPAGEVHLVFSLEVIRPRQLVRILHQIHALANVFEVQTVDSSLTTAHEIDAKSLYRPE
ncbi:MAG: bifunctional (p)ppGpp synthetase/guanosine-3',5'-bis(diphosphate) 3'-pyrophosphohydrolase [Chloroflexi bacterium]|nr:bifunctional (p)ppGpp synthetase/guanosine-3',5'-bis(diphosphate) 3'-pyrophosphohydrolase [Chloroflexota bacterium]